MMLLFTWSEKLRGELSTPHDVYLTESTEVFFELAGMAAIANPVDHDIFINCMLQLLQ